MTAEVYTVVLSPRKLAYYAHCVECDWTGGEHTWIRGSDVLAEPARAHAEKEARDHNEQRHPEPPTEDPAISLAGLVEFIQNTTFTPADAEVLGRIIAERTREPLPTEPGFYLDRLGQAWHLAHGSEWHRLFADDEVIEDTDPFDVAPLRKMEPAADTARAVLRALEERFVDGEHRMISYHDRDTIMARFDVEAPL